MATKFKVGDKVVITRKDKDFRYGYVSAMQDTIENGGIVTNAYGDTVHIGAYAYAEHEVALVQKAKTVKAPSRKPVSASLARKIGNAYAIVKGGEAIDYEYTREGARILKGYYGGASEGVSIVMLQPTMEVR